MNKVDKKRTLNLYGFGCTPAMERVISAVDTMSHDEILIVNCDTSCVSGKIRRMCMEKNYRLEIYRIDKNTMRYIISFHNE
mgnify:CR=1 FL=1